jgi:NitT/TauT family transport system permease protein
MSVDVASAPPSPPPVELSEAELTELTVRGPRERKASTSFAMLAWAAIWPKLLAIAMVLGLWEVAILAKWKPDYVLPGPGAVFTRLWQELIGQPPGVGHEHTLFQELAKTMQRGLTGYGLAIVIGTVLGVAVVQWRTLRLAIGSLIAGLQTMPSIAWFPLAMAFFGLHESAILFVVILGAAPSVAAGVISGIDEVPPPLLRAGKMIGARGVNRYRYVVLPAAMPSYLSGLKQGWAFSWRSLLAGELLVPIGGGDSSLGGALKYSGGVPNGKPWLLAIMIVILIVGMVMDAIFGVFTRQIRNRRGLTGMA